MSGEVKIAVYNSLKQAVGTGKAVVNGTKLDGLLDEDAGVELG